MKTTQERMVARELKLGKDTARKIVCFTACTARVAAIADPHVDLLLVGDAFALLMPARHCLRTSFDVVVDDAKAVVRSTAHAAVVVELPQAVIAVPDPAVTAAVAARMLDATGAQALMLDAKSAADAQAPIIECMTEAGMPVFLRINGLYSDVRSSPDFEIAQALAAERAGARAIVFSNISDEVGSMVTEALTVPTIGVGHAPRCDGQILVTDTILSRINALKDGSQLSALFEAYAELMREGGFPSELKASGRIF
jgi:3-methyl-2-oxobutanoate hydroxymethyltransferase